MEWGPVYPKIKYLICALSKSVSYAKQADNVTA